VESFQTFASALSSGDTTYYAILEPSTNEWEVGLGTWTESNTTLARTTILESSNSGSAINLTAGEAEVFITYPAEKAVYLDASGNISIAGTVDGRDISTDGTKLDGIEAGATIDQTASEILTAIKTVDGSGSGLDADLLDGVGGSGYARYDSSGTLSNALASEAWVANYNSSTNIDHVWHDDLANAWNFNSDSAFKGTANSRINAGSFYAGGNVVWNAGNDGSGSGLDADTVDGQHETDFVRTSSGTATSLDTTYRAGMFAFNTTTTGKPASNYGQGLAIVSSGSEHNDTSNWITQIGFGTDRNSAYFRGKTNDGDWNSWRTFWHDGNDGAGSGLDADLLDGNHSSAFATAAQGTTADAALPKAGGTMTGNVAYGDNVKATFGSSADLEVFHNGTNSVITDTGNGHLSLQSNGTKVNVYDTINSQAMANFNTGGSVQLFHNGSQKLETSSTGIDVTGTVVADGLTVDGTTKFLKSSSSSITLADSTQTNGYILKANTTDTADYGFRIEDLSGKDIFRANSSGDISFYEDTGTTAKLMWDASVKALEFGDAVKATFGAGSDLQIFHDGANSYILENGSGDLNIKSNGADVRFETSSGETTALFTVNGSVELYHDNAKKLETSSTGINVTGTVVADDELKIESASGYGRIEIGGPSGAFIDLKTPFSDDYDGRLITDGTSLYLTTSSDIPVMLKHNDAVKLSTTSTGISVTGNLAVTGTVDGRDIATNIPASLGTAGQVLTVNSGATAAEWANASASADITTVTPSGTTYTLDLSQGTHFDLGTIKEDSTVNVSNIPASGSFNFLFEADYFYNSIITWSSDFDWDGGYAPTLATNRKQLFSVYRDAGSSQLNSINTGNFTTDVVGGAFTIGSVGNTSINGGIVSVDLTSIADLKEDDLVIAFTGKADAGTAMPGNVTSSGWTQLGQNMSTNDTEDAAARVYYKFMGATPDTAFEIAASGGSDASQAVICYAVRGADLTTPFDGVTPTFNEVNNTVLANPPSITPSGARRLVVAAGFGASNGAVGTYASSDLSNFITVGVSDGGNTNIGVGSHIQLASSAYDPAAFTYSLADSVSDSCIGFTCVIKSATTS
jgi:hypothetical protein